MPDRTPRRRFTLADIMLLIASTAGLLSLIHLGLNATAFEPMQAVLASAAAFVGLGGLGACAARLRGRPRFEGFFWGVVCGPLGVLMFALMPDPPED